MPPYFDLLLQHFDPQESSRFVHLGHWEQAPSVDELAEPSAFMQAQQRLNDLMIDKADLHNDQAVLDVGCGLGGTLDKINRTHENMRLYGVNIDSRQLNICQQQQAKDGNRFVWQQGDACELPYPNASMDRIICLEAMFHFSSRQAFFNEVARVLKPGGIFVATDMTTMSELTELEAPAFLFEAAMVDGYGPWPDFWQQEGDYQSMAESAGLQLTLQEDASWKTLPSYHFTAPNTDQAQYDNGDIATRAALTMH